MSRSLIIGICITLVIISGLAAFFYLNFIKENNRPAIEAVPNDAAIIFEIHNIQKTWASFYATDVWSDLKKNEAMSMINTFINSADSIVKENSAVQNMLVDNRTIVSFHVNNGVKCSMLFVAETGSYDDINGFLKWITKATNGKSIKRIFDKETVYEIIDEQQKPLCTIAFYDKLLMLSMDGTLVEESIRKLKYNYSQTGKGLEKAKSIADIGSDMNVYINYQQLPLFLDLFSKDAYKGFYQYVKAFANWSLLNLDFEKEHISISGVTYTDDSLFQFLDLFKTQAPIENDWSALLPENTAYAMQLNFSNYTQFNSDLNEYLQNTSKLDGYIRYADSIEERYNIEVTDKIAAQIDKGAVLAIHEGNGTEVKQQVFALVTFKNNTEVQRLFNSYTQAIEQRGEADSVVSFINNIAIKRLPLGNIFKLFYGHMFESLESPFYVLKDDVFIMANSIATLKLILDELKSGNSLSANESFQLHRKASLGAHNVSLFINPSKCFQLPLVYCNDEFISALNRYAFDFKKFEFAEIQFANASNNSFFTNINIKFNPSFKEETQVLWLSKLDTTFEMQPVILYNSELKQSCILVQDVLNTVYFINNSGSILWRNKLSGKINSQVFEVDANKNGEISYLFSTTKQACLINASGNNIVGYPIRFPGTATAGINVFDFYNDSNFNFFVPLENNKAMGYQLNGKPIQGWNPKQLEAKITTKLSSFTLHSGSYLCASANNKQLFIYGLTNNQPKQVVQNVSSRFPAYVFSHDTVSASIWYTDTTGNIVQIAIDAQLSYTIKQIIVSSLSDIYHSVIQVTNGFWILAARKDGFDVYNQIGNKMMTENYKDSITTLPFFTYSKDNTPMLGFTQQMLGKVNCFDMNGKQFSSLPLDGITPFATGDFLRNNTNYLLCGDRTNNLMMYRLK
jgi:hypothetical protein